MKLNLVKLNLVKLNLVKLIKFHDEGSLTILIAGLFSLLLFFSFAIVNISGEFISQKELIHIGEVAVTRASHSLALDRYYAGDRTVVPSTSTSSSNSEVSPYQSANPNGYVYLVPIDCSVALNEFMDEINSSFFRGFPITLKSWSCVADVISATIASQVRQTLLIPMISGDGIVGIEATIGASSVYGTVN